MKHIIDKMGEISLAIAETAKDVNKFSITRKETSQRGLDLITELIEGNKLLKDNFGKIYKNLHKSLMGITTNADEFKINVDSFSKIILNINNIKTTLNLLNNSIQKMTSIVDEIRDDTDEIFTLALNASIVSSKYSHTSGVFDILANKLNEMSNFINQNLENIVHVVQPITDGLQKLISENVQVLTDIEAGHKSFLEFPDILEKQKESIDELTLRAYLSGSKIEDQQSMLDEISSKVVQMDQDANGSISGSANVIRMGESLSEKVSEVIERLSNNEGYKDIIEFIQEQASSIWQSATNVNEKSRSQHEFSLSSVDFCDSIIAESEDLKKTTEVLNSQSVNNNKMSFQISNNLNKLTPQLKDIENQISESNMTIQKFNEDYSQIDNIIEFLKDILQQMNVIGMYSRIESSRDPDEFQGFITISENIRKLHVQIQNNIPNIEENIEKTHTLIENVNNYFENISNIFSVISKSSSVIIEKLDDFTHTSSESERISLIILNESQEIDGILGELRALLIQLTEIVKKPIEGSALNIDRGKNIEENCRDLLKE